MVNIFEKIVDLIRIASQGHEMLHRSFEKAKWAFEKRLFWKRLRSTVY